MPDETNRAIDRLFDFVDNGVEAVDRVLNRHKYTEEQHQVRRNKQQREIIDADPDAKPKARTSSSTATAVAKKPHFYIAEAVDPKSGHTIFVVTDGGYARTECSTREFAAQILRALEKAP